MFTFSDLFNLIFFCVHFQSPQAEELSLLGVQLGSQFLFHSGFHTKKTLRGPAIDWYEALKIELHSQWYAFSLLFHFRFVVLSFLFARINPDVKST